MQPIKRSILKDKDAETKIFNCLILVLMIGLLTINIALAQSSDDILEDILALQADGIRDSRDIAEFYDLMDAYKFEVKVEEAKVAAADNDAITVFFDKPGEVVEQSGDHITVSDGTSTTHYGGVSEETLPGMEGLLEQAEQALGDSIDGVAIIWHWNPDNTAPDNPNTPQDESLLVKWENTMTDIVTMELYPGMASLDAVNNLNAVEIGETYFLNVISDACPRGCGVDVTMQPPPPKPPPKPPPPPTTTATTTATTTTTTGGNGYDDYDDPCVSNYQQLCGACGNGRIQCYGTCSGDTSACGTEGWKDTGSNCGNCGTQQRYCNGCDLTNSYQCVGEGVCDPSDPPQCSNNKYQSCTSSCAWSNSGTDADADGVDQQCEDSTCDNAKGVCDSAVSGKCIAKTTNEAACTDNLDNNCNGNIDCSDTNCAGSISGNVKNIDNEIVDNARIDTLKGVSIQHTAYTQPVGNYQINDVLCGTYNIIASEPDHVSSTKTITLAPKESKTVDFTGNDALVLGTTCEDDCTYTGDNLVHQECDGINGCTFNDATAMEVCNLAQPGWIRDYSDTQVIECAEGTPLPKVTTKAEVTCELENLLKITKVVVYKGKLVKLNIVTCR